MIIGFLQDNPGSRTGRMARVLADAGHECRLLTREPARLMPGAFSVTQSWATPHDYIRAIQRPEWQECDVWHVHLDLLTEWLTPLAALYRKMPGPRLVVDARDLDSLTFGAVVNEFHGQVGRDYVTCDELATFDAADGAIYVSERCREVSRVLHHPPDQTIVAYSYVTAAELPELPDPLSRQGVVYAGHLEDAGGKSYRDWSRGFAVLGQALDLHAYPINNQDSAEQVALGYRLRGVKMHEKIPPTEVLRELTKYRWALVGFDAEPDAPFPLGDAAAPNKLFEAVAAGCPVLVHCCDAAADLVKEAGIGLVARDPGRLAEQVAECSEEEWLRMAGRVSVLRHLWTQDEQLGRLVGFYRRVCNRPPRRSGGWHNTPQAVYDWKQPELQYWPIRILEEVKANV